MGNEWNRRGRGVYLLRPASRVADLTAATAAAVVGDALRGALAALGAGDRGDALEAATFGYLEAHAVARGLVEATVAAGSRARWEDRGRYACAAHPLTAESGGDGHAEALVLALLFEDLLALPPDARADALEAATRGFLAATGSRKGRRE
jgi:hypothetical protein